MTRRVVVDQRLDITEALDDIRGRCPEPPAEKTQTQTLKAVCQVRNIVVLLLHRRHIRYAGRVGTWKHLGRRAAWAATRRYDKCDVAPTWPVAQETRDSMRIQWPRRYGWSNANGWINPIKHGIARNLPIEYADIVQPRGNVVLFRVLAGNTKLDVIVDYSDQMDLNDSVKHVDLYFKMQFARHGYGTPIAHPGGYVSPHRALYTYARRWRALRDRTPPEFDVLGRFGMKWAQTIRGRAMTLLGAQSRFDFQGGAAVVWWGEYMDEITRASVCLDLPGNGEFCYRLVEYLGVGACIVGPELETEMPVPLQSGIHLVRIPRDLEALVEWCDKLASDHSLRDEIRRGAEDYFDRYLALDQLGAYYIDTCWRLLAQ